MMEQAKQLTKAQLSSLKKSAEAAHENDAPYKRDSNIQFVLYLIMVLAIALSIRLFITEPVRVDGDSMWPTLKNNERLFVEKASLWFEPPKRGEIVICYYPGYTASCVKRVIGLPGDTVSITNGILYVNGEELDESEYWDERGNIALDMGETVIPENSVFVVGDNRNYSRDSRAWGVGSIPYERVAARAHYVIWPLNARRSV